MSLGRWPLALRAAAVVALALVIHGRSVGFGFSFLDDDNLILEQQSFLAQPSSLWRSFGRLYFQTEGRDHAYYRPLVTASYGMDALWTGDNAVGYHLTNVGLHALAACLLYSLLRRLAGAPEGREDAEAGGGVRVRTLARKRSTLLGGGEGLAWAGALLFAAHPALTEAVAWIPGRNDTLLAVFGLGSWLLLLRSLEAGRWAWARRVGHLMTWLAALFTKEAAIALPVAYLSHLLLVERLPWRCFFFAATPAALPASSSTRAGARTRWLLPTWAVTLTVYLVARASVVGGGVGVAGMSAGRAPFHLWLFVSSLGKLLLPIHLSVLATPEDTWLWPGLVGVGLLAAAALLVPRLRRARAELLFGLVCFIAFVAPGLPASNLLVLESRLYLPAVAIAVGACAVARRAQLDGRPPARPRRARDETAGAVRLVAIALVVLLFAAASFAYGDAFRDRMAFSEAAVRGSPHSALAHRNLGVAYQISRRDVLARREYEAALSCDAAEPIVHNNLAVLLMAEGQLPEAEQQLRQELLVNPRYAGAHANLARVLGAIGRADEAATEWHLVLDLDAGEVEALRALRDYYAPRDAAQAARFGTMLESRGSTSNQAP
jgi:Tfp pilus assembly protein PilF